MAQQGFYNLSVHTEPTDRKPPRVGLTQERTGIPVFLLYLQEAKVATHRPLYSIDDVESLRHKATSQWDKSAWELLLPFFEAEGSAAHAVTVPISSNEKTRLQEMIGHKKGVAKHTGIHALRNAVTFADIVVVPQASTLLTGKSHQRYYHTLFELIEELKHFFLIVDFPRAFSKADTYNWLDRVQCADAAAYFPWMIVKRHGENCLFPPGPVIAAAYQQNDSQASLVELPANRALAGAHMPLFSQTPTELHDCLAHRLNTLHRFPNHELRIWGGQTLADKLDADSQFVSTRRTVLALNESIQEMCEPFVWEPASKELIQLIDVSLQSFLQSVKKLFDSETKTPFSTEIHLESRRGGDVVQVDVRFSLPYALNQVKLSFGLTG